MDKKTDYHSTEEEAEAFWNLHIPEDYLFKKNLATGLMLFSVIAGCLLIYFLMHNVRSIMAAFLMVVRAVMPVLYGLVIAFIINPVMVFIENFIAALVQEIKPLDEKKYKVIRLVSTILSVIFAVMCVYVLIRMILPQTIDSVYMLVQDLPEQSVAFSNKMMDYVEKKRGHSENLDYAITHATRYFNDWLRNDLLTSVSSLTKNLASGVFGMVNVVYKFVYNLVIGLIVAIYVLLSKEKFAGQSKKLLYGMFKTGHANTIIHYMRRANDIFVGFIIGKIIDSAIIGILCFIVTSIFSMPYAMLISFIIGVTNVIPVFGPFIGAIPSCLLVLIVSPIQALYLIVIILVLQQIDGNIIGPHILGDSIGISAFWVLFSILLFGNLMGIIGMIVGVPLFAFFYLIIKDVTEGILHNKKLKTDTKSYIDLDYIALEDEEKTSIKYCPLPEKELPSIKKIPSPKKFHHKKQ